jgi:leucyl/phenylalanyl-tRNA--protein transferase
MFPMDLPDGHLAWWCPVERTVIPLGGLRISKSLRQSTRRYDLTVDHDFSAVVEMCAAVDRPNGWITDEYVDAYTALHQMGWAHSIEVWDQNADLVGGLYGVAIGGLFAGESMFHLARDASKVALVHLMVVMGDDGRLVDVQWQTPHLESMGAVVIGREEYLRRLPEALAAAGPHVFRAG